MLKTALILTGLISTASLASEYPTPITEEAYTKGDCYDVDVYFNHELKQLEYEFYDYEAYTNIREGIWRDRKKCTVLVPIHVPHGWKVTVKAAILEYSGFVAWGGQGHTSLRYRFSGQSSEGITKDFPEGPLSHEDTRIIYYPEYERYSECGEDVELELKSTITVRAPSDGDKDTDVSFEAGFSNFKEKYFYNDDYDVAYQLDWQKC